MSQTSRNFHAHGGNEWVVGGKLTFLSGAIVEGAEGLFDLPAAGGAQLPYIKTSEATTVAALREDFNRLLAALRVSGLMASEAQPQQSEVVPTADDEDATDPDDLFDP